MEELVKTELNEVQREFLINLFKDDNLTGWRSISESLVDDGTCIVAGGNCPWMGGVGNFIDASESKNAVGCVKLTFDVSNFLTSRYFRDIFKAKIAELSTEMLESKKRYESMISLDYLTY